MTIEDYYKGYNIDRIAIEQMLDELNEKRSLLSMVEKEINNLDERIKRWKDDAEEAKNNGNMNEAEMKSRWANDDAEEQGKWVKIFDILSDALAEDH